jgi:hypothetical protein
MIVSGIICIAVGIVIMVFGIMHTTGNISTLHSYHRNNIKEENLNIENSLKHMPKLLKSLKPKSVVVSS